MFDLHVALADPDVVAREVEAVAPGLWVDLQLELPAVTSGKPVHQVELLNLLEKLVISSVPGLQPQIQCYTKSGKNLSTHIDLADLHRADSAVAALTADLDLLGVKPTLSQLRDAVNSAVLTTIL